MLVYLWAVYVTGITGIGRAVLVYLWAVYVTGITGIGRKVLVYLWAVYVTGMVGRTLTDHTITHYPRSPVCRAPIHILSSSIVC